MTDRLLGLAARYTKGAVAFVLLPSTEPLTDVRPNGLSGVTQLCGVDQSTGRAVDEAIDFVRHLIGGIEHGEIAMIAHPPAYYAHT